MPVEDEEDLLRRALDVRRRRPAAGIDLDPLDADALGAGRAAEVAPGGAEVARARGAAARRRPSGTGAARSPTIPSHGRAERRRRGRGGGRPGRLALGRRQRADRRRREHRARRRPARTGPCSSTRCRLAAGRARSARPGDATSCSPRRCRSALRVALPARASAPPSGRRTARGRWRTEPAVRYGVGDLLPVVCGRRPPGPEELHRRCLLEPVRPVVSARPCSRTTAAAALDSSSCNATMTHRRRGDVEGLLEPRFRRPLPRPRRRDRRSRAGIRALLARTAALDQLVRGTRRARACPGRRACRSPGRAS